MDIMRIYLDTCCLMRPYDDQSQPRIHMETLAVKVVLERIRVNKWIWVASDVLVGEVLQCPIEDRRVETLNKLEYADLLAGFTKKTAILATELAKKGLDWVDAAHVASAELAACDFFLSTDDTLLKGCRRIDFKLRLKAINPVNAAMEIPT